MSHEQLHQLIREANDPSASLRLRLTDLRIQPYAFGAQAGLASAPPAAPVLIDRAWPRASDPQRPCLKVDIVPAQSRGLTLPQSKSERDRPACAVGPLHRRRQDPLHLINRVRTHWLDLHPRRIRKSRHVP
jgi:hypothetical protein